MLARVGGPADVHLIATGKDDRPFAAAEALVVELVAGGLRSLYDDRQGVSPGVKFRDAELIGIPTIVTAGRALAAGKVEVRDRRSDERVEVDWRAVGPQLTRRSARA